jgi:hypothetical protein
LLYVYKNELSSLLSNILFVERLFTIPIFEALDKKGTGRRAEQSNLVWQWYAVGD